MSDQSNQTEQPAQTSEELRQLMLEQLDASKQAIEELSNEELEMVAGAGPSVAIPGGVSYSAVAASIHTASAVKSSVGKVWAENSVKALVGGATASVAVNLSTRAINRKS